MRKIQTLSQWSEIPQRESAHNKQLSVQVSTEHPYSLKKGACKILFFPLRVYPFDELFCRNTFGARFWWTDSSRTFVSMFSSLGQRPFYEKSMKTKGKRRKTWRCSWIKKKEITTLLYPDENLFIDSIQPIRLYLYNDGLVRLILITLFTIITKIIQETVFDKKSIISKQKSTTGLVKKLRSLMQRFATRPYTCDIDNLADKMVHLTNYRSFNSTSLF